MVTVGSERSPPPTLQIRRIKDRANSPDAHPLRRSQIEFLPRLHIEGGVPGINVAHGRGPILARSMGIGHDLLAQGSVPRLRPPVLGEGKEELLIVRETVLHWRCNGSYRAV